MGRIFGTDGIRGIANTELTCELAMNVARAAAMVVEEKIRKKPTLLIGKDTRLSSNMLESAVAAGLCSVGADAVIVGVVPTPAIAFLVGAGYADAGIMLSASHNPFEFNGLKVFGNGGYKLTEEQEFEIEAIVLDGVKPYSLRWNAEIGRISQDDTLLSYYTKHIADSITDDLSGIRIALDCSNGSSSGTAKKLFESLEIDVTILSSEPNGENINDKCGSTHIEVLAEYVKSNSFDAGFAFDGDADRCIAVDEAGNVLSGDFILAILADDHKARGILKDNTIVATVMSNLGLFKFAEERGYCVEQTRVGDKYVLDRLRENKGTIGGEESGHIILFDFANTGDGQLTALHILAAMKRSSKKLSELGSVMKSYPQVTKNLRADTHMKNLLDVDNGVLKIIQTAQEKLGTDGRILVRASGTEPVIRVMIEGKKQEEIAQLAEWVTDQIKERLLSISLAQ